MTEELEGEIVTVRERRQTSWPKIGQPVRVVAVTYSTPDLPPRTIWIPEAEYSEEHRDALIKRDMQERRATPGKEIRL